MSNCSDCKNNGTQICSVCCSYQGCPDRWEAKPTTNADRIRAMSDEELAKWFVDIQLYIYKCTLQGKEPKEYPYTETGWREWLKQETEDD